MDVLLDTFTHIEDQIKIAKIGAYHRNWIFEVENNQSH